MEAEINANLGSLGHGIFLPTDEPRNKSDWHNENVSMTAREVLISLARGIGKDSDQNFLPNMA